MWQGMKIRRLKRKFRAQNLDVKILRRYAVTPLDLSMESSVNGGDQVQNI